MERLTVVPKGIDQINGCYGNPDVDGDHQLDKDWFVENIHTFRLPYPMRAHWNHDAVITNLQMHYLVAPVMLDALEEVLRIYGQKELRRNAWDITAGTFCFREMKGTYGGVQLLTTHAWGIAIDLNPQVAPYDREAYNAGRYVHGQPIGIIEAFEKRGFINLPWDRMHFQACSCPWPLEWGGCDGYPR